MAVCSSTRNFSVPFVDFADLTAGWQLAFATPWRSRLACKGAERGIL